MLNEEKKQQRDMMIAMVLVIGVLMLFNRLTAKPEEIVQVPLETPTVVETKAVETAPAVIEKTIPSEKQVVIPMKNNFVDGSFVANNTDFNDLLLTQYKETTEENSPAISLLNKDFQTTSLWTGANLPDMAMEPTVQGDTLTPETPIVLTWANDTAVIERTVSLDNGYMLAFTDKITNKTNADLNLALTGKIIRAEDSIEVNRSSVHVGFLGLFDNQAEEEDYTSIKENEPQTIQNKGGWIGITDKYWQAVWVPEQNMASDMTFAKLGTDYVSSFKTPATVKANETITHTTKLFAGPKELSLIEEYEEQGIPRFDLSIDFGWYYFLTKPFLRLLGWLYGLIGNMGVVILIFATLIRIALLPIATKSYESMAKMKKIQPKIKAIQERFKDNRQQLQIEMMNLYKRDKVNPASGCLPMLIQIPVFFALYKVLSVSILMRQAPFWGWIHDLSQPDPSSVFTAFGYLPWPIPSFLNIGVWPLIMGLTMIIQQKLSPSAATTKDQKIMMNMMPVIFTFMMGNFAAGLVIYWTWSNILSIAQQKYIMKKLGA